MTKSHIKIFKDVENPDGDLIAFETEDEKTLDTIITYLGINCKAVDPE